MANDEVYSKVGNVLRFQEQFLERAAAYRRIDSGTGTLDDLLLCANGVYDKIVSAAETNLSKEYSLKELLLDKINCHPDEILAIARPKLEGNLMPLEEKIFRAVVHFNRYLKNIDYWNELLEETTQEYRDGFKSGLDICKSPEFTNRIKRGTLKRLEDLRKAMADLSIATSDLYTQENIEGVVGIIDNAYGFKSTAHGQLYYPNDLECALA